MKITISKSQWKEIGKKANWYKTAQEEVISRISDLIKEEREYKKHTADIPAMEEATPEDLEEGYGAAMSGKEYQESLIDPFVEVMAGYPSRAVGGGPRIAIYFYGNYPASSVNAGRTRKVFIDQLPLEAKDEAIEMARKIEALGIPVSVDLDMDVTANANRKINVKAELEGKEPEKKDKKKKKLKKTFIPVDRSDNPMLDQYSDHKRGVTRYEELDDEFTLGGDTKKIKISNKEVTEEYCEEHPERYEWADERGWIDKETGKVVIPDRSHRGVFTDDGERFANNNTKGDTMKIKISKSQWEEMGKKAGWLDIFKQQDPTEFIDPDLEEIKKKKQIEYWALQVQDNPENIKRCPKDIRSSPEIQAALKTAKFFENRDTSFNA